MENLLEVPFLASHKGLTKHQAKIGADCSMDDRAYPIV